MVHIAHLRLSRAAAAFVLCLGTVVTFTAANQIPADAAPTQLLTGSALDGAGHAMAGLRLYASNTDGSNQTTVDADGNFSMYVPAGTVGVSFDKDQRSAVSPDPMSPWYIGSPQSGAVAWTESEGPLALTFPTAHQLTVNVTSGGEPVEGASVTTNQGGDNGYGAQLSSAFTLRAATDTTNAVVDQVGFNSLNRWGSAATDANGDAFMWVWPTDDGTIQLDASATFQSASIHGTMTGVPADGQPHSVAFTIPGNLTYADEFASAPFLTSLSLQPGGGGSPIALTPGFAGTTTIYDAGPVAFDLDAVEVTATASAVGSQILVYGDTGLTIGQNLVTVQVVDPDTGSARTYTIRVLKDSSPPSTTTTSTTQAPTTTTSTTQAPTTTTSTTQAPTTTTSTTQAPTTTPTTVRGGEDTLTFEELMALPPAEIPLVDPAVFQPQGTVTVDVGGFAPGESVQLLVASTPQVITTVVADGAGRVVASGQLPSDLVAGAHELAVYAPARSTGVRQGITVLTASVPAEATAPSGTLPFTGADVQPALVGLLLVAGGLLLTTLVRRRRPV
jgi:hypothetical protein